ncbi:MAG: type III restriction-modification system endonuclease [Flammeovirgaceae bacterium]
MKGFNFEKDLEHQKQAVESTIAVFEELPIPKANEINKNYVNPVLNYQNEQYKRNILQIRTKNQITQPPTLKANSNIIDIMMETGTGKTYTYTKTIFELNKKYSIFKFIIIVPTLSIKAGTINFLKSDSCREHFKEQYSKTLQLHVVESIKSKKSKKSTLPPAVSSFVNAGNFDNNTIHVMIINAGMINSDTMQKTYDRTLLDKYTVPFEAIAFVKPFVIIDEPHRFAQDNKTWTNIQKMKPQFILRYGATFQQYENLVYTLTAVDAFNRNLVKGVIGHITEFESGKNAIVRFIDSDGKEATFECIENNSRKTIKISKKESLQKLHSQMSDLFIENLNKSTVVLSNGLEMKKSDKINPYSYAQKLQEIIIQKAIKNHFQLEKELLTRKVKIKPLTLFFIDNIEEYRNQDGYIRKIIEQYIEAEVKQLLTTETDTFYKSYLQKTLQNLSATHGGYFSQDNTEKDEAIEKELNEILHDKQALLDLENTRRFIFSKWTLREGWDNPNVFQICKLRSSGSEISKLQEVGRGLRLPVNEFGNREKDEQFYLHYFVDFTESDFVDKLVNEINEKSNAFSIEQTPEKLTDEMIQRITEVYGINEEKLLEELDEQNVITRSNAFKEGGFEYIKQNYSKIFQGVNSNKIRKANEPRNKITIRTEKYPELKDLWEKLNEKVVLEYKFKHETDYKELFAEYLKNQEKYLTEDAIHERISKVNIKDNKAQVNESQSIYKQEKAGISTMKYNHFLKELSTMLNINRKTLHEAIKKSGIDLNQYLNLVSLRILKQNFDAFLMTQAFDKYSIEYKKVSNSIHPTKLTDENGNVLKEISAANIGIFFSDEKVADSYFFNELFYDSELEKANIQTEIDEVIVFTKIPKNSIKIPVAGGKSYSPDFAYVLKLKNGQQKLHFIVETKNYENQTGLSEEEKAKLRHAEEFFGGNVKIKFKTQFSNNKIAALIKEIINTESDNALIKL